MRSQTLFLVGLIFGFALLAGCALGPDYKRPAVNTPSKYRFAKTQGTESLGDLLWWQVFKDPNLQDLIRTALANNYDLAKAVARVEQAREQAVVAGAPLFPQIGYGGGIGRGQNALYNSPANLNGGTTTSVYGGPNAAWEIDIWGRIRRLNEAARAEYLATEEVRRGVIVSLISDVAIAYFQLEELDAELAIQHDAVAAYTGTLRIFNDRLTNGVGSKLETDRASGALNDAAAAIPQLELQIASTENQISVLAGRNPGPIKRGSLAGTPKLAPRIPAGLPSELLQRRPDVVANEELLIAANARIGASFANFFPQLGLTTFLGKVSPELSALTGGSSSAWNVGATLAGPLFQGGAILAQYRAAKAKFDEATADYEQSVLNALREVSNALIARQKLAEALIFNERSAAALASSVQLAKERYLVGKSSYYEVLQAQQELYPTQRAQSQTQAGELIAVVQLYKALGGGWQVNGNAGSSR